MHLNAGHDRSSCAFPKSAQMAFGMRGRCLVTTVWVVITSAPVAELDGRKGARHCSIRERAFRESLWLSVRAAPRRIPNAYAG